MTVPDGVPADFVDRALRSAAVFDDLRFDLPQPTEARLRTMHAHLEILP
jgi:hypothetical protein